MTTQPPGFYPDPHDPSNERWWNGSGWSDQVRPALPPDPRAEDVDPHGWAMGKLPANPVLRRLVLTPAWVLAGVGIVALLFPASMLTFLPDAGLLRLVGLVLFLYGVLGHPFLRRHFGYRLDEPGEGAVGLLRRRRRPGQFR